jgi:hypothetical protein
MNSQNYQIIRQSMLLLKPVSLVYSGHPRLVCAHALGLSKDGREQALVFQYGGSSSSGLPPGGEWRCLRLGGVIGPKVTDGSWSTRHDHEETQTCVAQVDVEVWVDASGQPYVKRA